MPLDVAELVAAAQGGDREAFDELVRVTYAESYTLALRLTGNEEDARDVVQETYLRAYKGIGKFRGEAKVSTWLYRITANCAANQLGNRRRHRHDELDDEGYYADRSPTRDPVAMAEAGNLRERLTDALAELPPTLRQVVVLRDVYDLAHDDIAKELGISTSAAKVRLHRARKVLKERLFPLPGGEEGTARAV